ncbi:MAG: hypothetical protein QXK06_00970 [Candidatus Diapherotrites archaeon]
MMNPLVREITDFKSLQVYVQSSQANLVESTKRYYFNLGKKLGLDAKTEMDVLLEKVQLPKPQLAWLDAGKPVVAFYFCFGSKEEMLAGIFSLLALNADLSVIITSSKARTYSIKEIKTILEEAVFLNLTTKFLLVDISKEEWLVL